MNLDLALERLRDLPDDELIAVGRQLQDDYNAAKERWKRAEFEIIRRQDEQDSTLLLGEAGMVETKWTGEYEWDIDVVERYAPEHVTVVPPVPARKKVKNTIALNNYIKKLGQSDAGQQLRAARTHKRKYATLKFSTIIDSRGE